MSSKLGALILILIIIGIVVSFYFAIQYFGWCALARDPILCKVVETGVSKLP